MTQRQDAVNRATRVWERKAALRVGGAVVIADGIWRTWRHCWERGRDSLRPGADHAYPPRLVRGYLATDWKLSYWRGIGAAAAHALLGSAGFFGLERFDHLVGVDARPLGAEFFVMGARNPAFR